jgi:plastocyanin
MFTSLAQGRRALALLIAVIAVVACSAVAALAAASAQVKVADNYFSVKRLTVGDGAKVTWKWTGVLYHNVTVLHGPARFSSRTQAAGTFSHVFSKPGTYTLYCTIHPKTMQMVVVVK